MGAELIIAVMSGNATQRGECALIDKHRRARAALECGADIVLELPFPWCASGAESFGRCGVYILSPLCDTLLFGSECGDTEKLKRAAGIAADESFRQKYSESLEDNRGSAELYFELLRVACGEVFSSNDILGIEYIKAIEGLSSDMTPVTVKRLGADYSERNITEGSLQSATAIRRLLSESGCDSVSEYLPEPSLRMIADAMHCGEIYDDEALVRAEKLYFRLVDPEALSDIADTDLGLISRICNSARDVGEGRLLEVVKTKRYTDARLRRAILFAMTGVKKSDMARLPEYVNLLGANKRGREYLASKRGKLPYEILSKASDIPRSDGAKRQAELSLRLDAIFTLSRKKELPEGEYLRRSPVII